MNIWLWYHYLINPSTIMFPWLVPMTGFYMMGTLVVKELINKCDKASHLTYFWPMLQFYTPEETFWCFQGT